MDKTLDLDEAIARLIDPSSWRVFDSELERVKRHHPNGGYDPDNFKDRASLALAGRILTLIAAARPAVVSDEKPDPNPEWEAKADAEHAAIREEVGECDPLAALTMLKTWKAHAEPADQDGRITFSRAMLDSAEDALEVALKLSSGGFVRGAQEAREMLARFVEQGGDAVIANSIRLNWNPSWGDDPGPPDRPDADTTERQPSPRDEQNPSASPKEVSQ